MVEYFEDKTSCSGRVIASRYGPYLQRCICARAESPFMKMAFLCIFSIADDQSTIARLNDEFSVERRMGLPSSLLIVRCEKSTFPNERRNHAAFFPRPLGVNLSTQTLNEASISLQRSTDLPGFKCF